MRSRKAQCQAPPDNPEIGDTYHSSRGKNCAGEKIEQHQTYTISGTAAVRVRMYVYKRGRFPQTRDLWRKRCEYGLTRWTCFTARRLEVVAVAGLLWIYFVVCFGCGGVFSFFFFRFLYFERTRPTASTRPPCLTYLSTSKAVGASPRQRLARQFQRSTTTNYMTTFLAWL